MSFLSEIVTYNKPWVLPVDSKLEVLSRYAPKLRAKLNWDDDTAKVQLYDCGKSLDYSERHANTFTTAVGVIQNEYALQVWRLYTVAKDVYNSKSDTVRSALSELANAVDIVNDINELYWIFAIICKANDDFERYESEIRALVIALKLEGIQS